MKIILGLGWAEVRAKNFFKESSMASLCAKYQERINRDFSFEIKPMSFDELKSQNGLIWICERIKKSKMLTSEELADRFQKACDSGAKSLTVWIGGPDGLKLEQLASLRTDLLWSFGPMTLPHELAAVVASEQLYRAVSILKNHPYHTGH